MKANGKLFRTIGAILLLAQILCLFLPFYRISVPVLYEIGYYGEDDELNLEDYDDITEAVSLIKKQEGTSPAQLIGFSLNGGAEKIENALDNLNFEGASTAANGIVMFLMLMFAIPLVVQICGGVFGLVMKGKKLYIIFAGISFALGTLVVIINLIFRFAINGMVEENIGDELALVEYSLSAIGLDGDLIGIFFSAGIGFYLTFILDVAAVVMAVLCGMNEGKMPAAPFVQPNSPVGGVNLPQPNLPAGGVNIPQPNLPAGGVNIPQPNSPVVGMNIPQPNSPAGGVNIPQPNSPVVGLNIPQPNSPAGGMNMPQPESPVVGMNIPQPEPSDTGVNTTEPKGVMRGLAGMYAGAEIPLNNGAVIIGRDASRANLIYDESCAKVSRKHCELSYDNESKMFSIIDYSSTGTFKNGNTNCLPQNMRVFLEPGSVIDIGDETNRFILE
jgi:hypothetical protein